MAARSQAPAPDCPPDIRALVARFAEHREAYQQQTYNETQVRREFIDPFFAALGWDIDNRAGLAEAYKDVIHEDAIKIGGETKAPDYCFRIGGVRKFFVEAKKPAVGVGTDPGPAYQLRRYAWTSKLPLSIVTDFEEFAVYDCRVRPNAQDKATTARVLYCTFDQYAAKWGDIADIFSKDAILKGSFDKYAESTARKRGTAEVDDEILREIEEWRSALARSLALRNPRLSVRELNYAVAKIIDRIIFLRMCEDRGIETYAQLRVLLNGDRTYRKLVELFRAADERYNSGLFHFQQERDRPEAPDELTPRLEVDDKVLKDIIRTLYYPDCPYEFSVLPVEILGQVYEQFLGKVIRLTAGHQAKVEEKPEVKKAGGVYYTPAYIVDYIVQNTVGKLLEGKTPKEASKLRIVDPACGSGSFLLGAYQHLLDWHRDWYVAQLDGRPLSDGRGSDWNPDRDIPNRDCQRAEPEPNRDRQRADQRRETEPNRDRKRADFSDRIYQPAAGQWRLTIKEKKRILLNNLYGVDIDPQAVETTKLSLLLKVLEGETGETIGQTMRLFHERALPDLGANIKCGNSLIGPDFYDNRQMTMFDEEERYRINAFDWQAEFPSVFRARATEQNRDRKRAEPTPEQNRDRERAERRAARGEKPLADGRGSDRAAPDGGFDAVIGNPPWGQKDIDKDPLLSAYLRSRYVSLVGILDVFRPFIESGIQLTRPGGIFGMVLPDVVLLKDYPDTRKYILENLSLAALDWWGMAFSDATIDACTIIGARQPAKSGHVVRVTIHDPQNPLSHGITQSDFWSNDRFTFNLHLTPERRALLDRLAKRPKLAEYFEVHEGVHSGNIRLRLFVDKRVDKTCREMYFGRDEIVPHHVVWKGMFIRLSAVPSRKSKAAYANAGKPEWYDQPKILLRRTGDFVLAAVDKHKRYASNNFFIAFPIKESALDLYGLAALLNARFMTWFFRTVEPRAGRVFAELKIKHVSVFPLPLDGEERMLTRLNTLGETRSNLAQPLAAAKTPDTKTALRRQIDATDRQIDRLVYDLYGLTEDEIRIVEEATA